MSSRFLVMNFQRQVMFLEEKEVSGQEGCWPSEKVRLGAMV